MGKLVGLGIAAGLASALLFGVVATGAPAGMLMCYLAPLPIVIVTLGWHQLIGLLAAAIGASALSFAIGSSAGLAFFLGPAVPAWALSYLAITRWPVAVPDGTGGRTVVPGWLPPGHLLLATAAAGSIVALVSAFAIGQGSYERFEETLRGIAEGLLRTEMRTPRGEPLATVAGMPGATFVAILIAVAPAVAAAAFSLAFAANLWLGGRIVAVSGRLPRDLPRVPDTRMPPLALWAFLGGLLLALAAGGYPALAGRVVTGAFGLLFAVQGLAFIHTATRGRSTRGGVLTLAYLLTVFVGGTFIPMLTLLGMADTALPIRRRFEGPPADNPPSPPPYRS